MAVLADNWLNWVIEGRFLDNSAGQWLGLLGTIVAAVVLGKIVAVVLHRQANLFAEGTRLAALGLMLRSLVGPAQVLMLAGALYLAQQFMTLQKIADGKAAFDLRRFWEQVVTALAVLAAGWFIYRLVDIVEHFLHRWAVRAETTLDAQLVPLIRKALRAFVVIALSLFVAQNVFNWNIGALLAGLGIGGLAVALAAQSLLADIFGSVRIFADRPFRLGETIKVNAHCGAVEEIGFRSTRIRTAEGDVVTIPNSVVAAAPVENLSRRTSLRRELRLTVAYDTPSGKLQRAVEILRRLLEERKGSFPADLPPRVFFSDFVAGGLCIVVTYWFAPPDGWAFQRFNHEFNMDVFQRFEGEGISFTFPTRAAGGGQNAPS